MSNVGFEKSFRSTLTGSIFKFYWRNVINVVLNQIDERDNENIIVSSGGGMPSLHPPETEIGTQACKEVKRANKCKEKPPVFQRTKQTKEVFSTVGHLELFRKKSWIELSTRSLPSYPLRVTMLNFRNTYKHTKTAQEKTLAMYLPFSAVIVKLWKYWKYEKPTNKTHFSVKSSVRTA